MNCAWQEFLNLIPPWLRQTVDKQGRGCLQELRLRMDYPPELVTSRGNMRVDKTVSLPDLEFCVNIASQYSPWTTDTLSNCYITAAGGHRLGLCGEVNVQSGCLRGINTITSVCIRVARDFPGIASKAAGIKGSLLIVGRPGSGKTTLLRDLIRLRSDIYGECISVIDERTEIFPRSHGAFCFVPGKHVDVLSGCPKRIGIENLLKCMSPDVIAIDEITCAEDCRALLSVGWCGVDLIATAHAGSLHAFLNRHVYKPVVESGIFDQVLVLRPDKSWVLERLKG